MKFACTIMLTAGMLVAVSQQSYADETEDFAFFREKIVPLLETHCLECHSHASGQMENGLTLDARAGWEEGGDSGPAVVPGDTATSLLIQAIRYGNTDLQMPPDEKLTDAEIALFEDWVQRGAPDPREASITNLPTNEWWSLQPIARPEIPQATTQQHQQHPIDAFINKTLVDRNISAVPRADRRTLIRRLYIDLHGLPPTPEEVQSFVDDPDPEAYEKLVDRLLKSPRYGERGARQWLDTIHFADSHGCEHDVKRPNAWRFRDYVIDRLNDDVPWARFIREQLAADVFFPEQPELIPALGFIAAGPLELSRAKTAPITFDYLDRDDMVTQTMSAFVSTTANCARCHAHKFDPITQEDYYALQAVFAGVGKGDIDYDASRAEQETRLHWESLLAAAKAEDASILDATSADRIVAAWEATRAKSPVQWAPLKPDLFLSAEGATLIRQDDDALLATGHQPKTDTYTISSPLTISRLTAIRLDVFKDSRLPKNGPGRQDNGNLHLTEVVFQLFQPEAAEPVDLQIKMASADWNQDGWTIDHAIDGKSGTAWGIFPRVGESHHAVFELKQSIEVKNGDRIAVMLKQLHGAAHLIGRFRLSVTDASPDVARAVPSAVSTVLSVPVNERTHAQKITIASHVLHLHARSQLSKLPPRETVYAVSSSWNRSSKLPEPAAPKVVHLLRRGDINHPVRKVPPGALTAIDCLPARFPLQDPEQETQRRAALADWIASNDNPLTWRSAVNRVWQHHFGEGLCSTPNDFGRMGSQPSHPELLDWLAVWFRDDAGGSLKELSRLILTSHAWKRVSHVAANGHTEALASDAENTLLWRMPRTRLDAESFRDSVLQISNQLDSTMGGPGVEHFATHKGQQSTPRLEYGEFDWNSDAARRRSIYRVVWREIPDPFMEALDFPDLGLLVPKRRFSVSALQSLALYNNEFVLHGSEWLATRLQQEETSNAERVRRAVALVWLREPSHTEYQQFLEHVESHGLAALCRVLFNSNQFLFVD
jgi:hypothetical protein